MVACISKSTALASAIFFAQRVLDCCSIVGDLSNKNGIKSVVDAFASKEDHLDILVHNTGYNSFPASYPVTEDRE